MQIPKSTSESDAAAKSAPDQARWLHRRWLWSPVAEPSEEAMTRNPRRDGWAGHGHWWYCASGRESATRRRGWTRLLLVLRGREESAGGELRYAAGGRHGEPGDGQGVTPEGVVYMSPAVSASGELEAVALYGDRPCTFDFSGELKTGRAFRFRFRTSVNYVERQPMASATSTNLELRGSIELSPTSLFCVDLVWHRRSTTCSSARIRLTADGVALFQQGQTSSLDS